MAGRIKCRGNSTCEPSNYGSPELPHVSKECEKNPPCPAQCNPSAPPTPAEREVSKLSEKVKQLDEGYKSKVTECAILRREGATKRQELERERCLRREIENKMREMELKFQGLATHTNMLLGTKEQAFEQETSVATLKQCYREAKEEIEDLRIVLKEQDEQIQDYRAKYMQAQQLVEEQRRQMDMLDMDNTRISEQINLEIQRVKLKFQEKLQELSPLPDILKNTQARLKEAQNSQAIAEHNAESLARELHACREKVHLLLHNTTKPPERDTNNRKDTDEKQISLLQQRIQSLNETNINLRQENERLKANVIRQEEAVLVNEKRLQEKMHECAQLGGDLDRAREEAARAISRAHERTDTVRKCLQDHVAEIERQLAYSRAQYNTAAKERDELRNRMQCQIDKLNDNFSQAQNRIIGLQSQVQKLRHTSDEAASEDQEPCSCRTIFE